LAGGAIANLLKQVNICISARLSGLGVPLKQKLLLGALFQLNKVVGTELLDAGLLAENEGMLIISALALMKLIMCT
jgi:hypothetical protein